MACGLHFQSFTMQIPYDLEFVENRPRVETRTRAAALPDPYAAWRSRPERSQEDAFDALLHWVHRVISRLEQKP